MKRWEQLEQEAPELAAGGRQLVYQFGIGLGFLATIRSDGGPRLHPVCPIIAEGGLYLFIIPSPKLGDLRRDGRFALHAFPPAETDDEFMARGRVVEIEDPRIRARIDEAYQNDAGEQEVLFELLIENCLLARYTARGAFPPAYTRWSATEGLIT